MKDPQKKTNAPNTGSKAKTPEPPTSSETASGSKLTQQSVSVTVTDPPIPVKKNKKSLYSSRSKPGGDILNPIAVENAYYICHNVQDCLAVRGFKWQADSKAKKSRSSKK